MNFSCKPVFIGWIALLCQLPFQLFFTLWGGGFFGGMTMAFLYPKNTTVWWPFILFGGLAFLGFPVVTYWGKKLNYQRTEYRFFEDRMEFEEGFFTNNKKTIKYKDVKEVNLRKGIFQKIYGLGTVYLATTATGSSARNNFSEAFGFGNVSGSGVGVRDVSDPDAVYEKIKAQVEAKNI